MFYKYYNCETTIPLLKTNPPRITRTKSNIFTIQKPNGDKLVTFDKNSLTYQWIFTEPYRDMGLKLPYVLIVLDDLVQFDVKRKEKLKRDGIRRNIKN